DPNRALVYLLQLQSVGAISRETVMRLQGQLSKGFDPSEEMRRIDVEQIDSALMAGIQSLAASFPSLPQIGQDPRAALMQVAHVKKAIKAGKPADEAILEAF